MSERTIRVQPSELSSASKNIANYRNNFIDAYEDLVNKVKELTNSTWGGTDADAFAQKINLFKSDFQKMDVILQDYSSMLERAAEAYRQAQTNVTNNAGTLKDKV